MEPPCGKIVRNCSRREQTPIVYARQETRWGKKLLKKRPEEVLRRFQKRRPGEAALSVITYGELLYGAAKSKQPVLALERLRELVRLLPALALSEAAAELYGRARRTGRQRSDAWKQRFVDCGPRSCFRTNPGYEQRKEFDGYVH
jgi:hypothetical protein